VGNGGHVEVITPPAIEFHQRTGNGRDAAAPASRRQSVALHASVKCNLILFGSSSVREAVKNIAMRNLTLCRIAFITLLFALPGCDQSRKQIVGKWKVLRGSSDVVWEFFENGSVSTGGTPGKYTFGDGRRIKIQTPTATFVHQIEFVGDRMIWKALDGTRTELTRVK
jgi:hypothetical protein